MGGGGTAAAAAPGGLGWRPPCKPAMRPNEGRWGAALTTRLVTRRALRGALLTTLPADADFFAAETEGSFAVALAKGIRTASISAPHHPAACAAIDLTMTPTPISPIS